MIEISLSQGKFALIDDEDFENVSQYNWQAHYDKRSRRFYGRRLFQFEKKGKRTTVTLHRFIMNAEKGQIVDHIDGDGLNNQKANLRFVTNAQNMWNSKKKVMSSTGFFGVSFHKGKAGKSKPFISHIKAHSKSIHLGYFSTAIEAAQAYDLAAIKYHGEFARLNFPEIKS